jgi:hypothetical protein
MPTKIISIKPTNKKTPLGLDLIIFACIFAFASIFLPWFEVDNITGTPHVYYLTGIPYLVIFLLPPILSIFLSCASPENYCCFKCWPITIFIVNVIIFVLFVILDNRMQTMQDNWVSISWRLGAYMCIFSILLSIGGNVAYINEYIAKLAQSVEFLEARSRTIQVRVIN